MTLKERMEIIEKKVSLLADSCSLVPTKQDEAREKWKKIIKLENKYRRESESKKSKKN